MQVHRSSFCGHHKHFLLICRDCLRHWKLAAHNLCFGSSKTEARTWKDQVLLPEASVTCQLIPRECLCNTELNSPMLVGVSMFVQWHHVSWVHWTSSIELRLCCVRTNFTCSPFNASSCISLFTTQHSPWGFACFHPNTSKWICLEIRSEHVIYGSHVFVEKRKVNLLHTGWSSTPVKWVIGSGFQENVCIFW